MTPDQERKLDRCLEAIVTVANAQGRTEARFAKIEHGMSVLFRWVRQLREETPRETASIRPPMPSLTEASGSVELGAFGATAKFHGAGPVRAGVALLIVLVVLAAGWGLHAALASPRPTIGTTP
jgi:hypothetical protein